MAKFVKQLTRENTLLDRGFRSLAYAQSMPEIGKARIAKSPIVGRGRVTSLYYDPEDYKKQQQIILNEFKGKRVGKMGRQIMSKLRAGHEWAKFHEGKKVKREHLPDLIRDFMKHHAFARGAIVYGYWGEPVVTSKLKKLLAKKLPAHELDATLSILSVPKQASGMLKELHGGSVKLARERARLIKKLKLTKQERELAEILSWFTAFYELGERVAGKMFDFKLNKLKKLLTKTEFEEIQWYDPDNLIKFLKGQKLSKQEIARRQKFYIIIITKGKALAVLSGEAAQAYFKRNFEQDIVSNASEVKGVVASMPKKLPGNKIKGVIRGRVKIVITETDQNKMQHGDILVSTMTTPRLMSAMKKAAAIVTDEGGLTAHAAIVARELGIACIVGTKFATKIFKDGDLVEIDAKQGIVKKIK